MPSRAQELAADLAKEQRNNARNARELAELHITHGELMEDLARNAPESWDGDDTAEVLVLEYLRTLEAWCIRYQGRLPERSEKEEPL